MLNRLAQPVRVVKQNIRWFSTMVNLIGLGISVFSDFMNTNQLES